MVDLLIAPGRAVGMLGIVFAVACGGRGERAGPPATEGPAPGTTRPAVVDSAPREISTDRANADDPGAGTPARRASQRVVEEGKGYLIAERPRDAADRFERATRIDPTNGFAYYYLGRARVDLGDRRGAIGMLEKAESLLGPYPEWRSRASALAESLAES